jgi:hypothetical protein
LLGSFFLGLALIITPFAPAVQRTLPISQPAAHPAASQRYASSARAALVAAEMRFYAARPGDTLSALARQFYGSSRLWPALWWVNRHAIPNPDALPAGTTLQLSAWHPHRAWLGRAAVAAIPVPKPPPPSPAPVAGAAAAPPLTPAAPVTVSAGAPGGFQACVIARESGGNPNVMNASGHYGLYQFSEQTWVAYGGSAADFGNASAAEQTQVFDNAMATPAGASNWSPYDGC